MDWKTHIECLLSAGVSVSSIAERIGVTPNAVREILAGRTKSPRGNAALALAALTPDDFPACNYVGPAPQGGDRDVA